MLLGSPPDIYTSPTSAYAHIHARIDTCTLTHAHTSHLHIHTCTYPHIVVHAVYAVPCFKLRGPICVARARGARGRFTRARCTHSARRHFFVDAQWASLGPRSQAQRAVRSGGMVRPAMVPRALAACRPATVTATVISSARASATAAACPCRCGVPSA